MKEIPLTQNKVALVDDKDFEHLNQYKWYATKSRNTYYAARNTGKQPNHHGHIYMHRQILNVAPGVQTDHINHNGLDNHKGNLRICTNTQNHQNQKTRKDKTSKYKGASWIEKRKKWMARIRFNKKPIHIGYYMTEIEAAKAYDQAAKRLFGKFAYTNF